MGALAARVVTAAPAGVGVGVAGVLAGACGEGGRRGGGSEGSEARWQGAVSNSGGSRRGGGLRAGAASPVLPNGQASCCCGLRHSSSTPSQLQPRPRPRPPPPAPRPRPRPRLHPQPSPAPSPPHQATHSCPRCARPRRRRRPCRRRSGQRSCRSRRSPWSEPCTAPRSSACGRQWGREQGGRGSVRRALDPNEAAAGGNKVAPAARCGAAAKAELNRNCRRTRGWRLRWPPHPSQCPGTCTAGAEEVVEQGLRLGREAQPGCYEAARAAAATATLGLTDCCAAGSGSYWCPANAHLVAEAARPLVDAPAVDAIKSGACTPGKKKVRTPAAGAGGRARGLQGGGAGSSAGQAGRQGEVRTLLRQRFSAHYGPARLQALLVRRRSDWRAHGGAPRRLQLAAHSRPVRHSPWAAVLAAQASSSASSARQEGGEAGMVVGWSERFLGWCECTGGASRGCVEAGRAGGGGGGRPKRIMEGRGCSRIGGWSDARVQCAVAGSGTRGQAGGEGWGDEDGKGGRRDCGSSGGPARTFTPPQPQTFFLALHVDAFACSLLMTAGARTSSTAAAGRQGRQPGRQSRPDLEPGWGASAASPASAPGAPPPAAAKVEACGWQWLD